MRLSILMVILLIIPLATANLVYEGWVESDDYIQLQGSQYNIVLSKDGRTLILNGVDQTKGIPLEECEALDIHRFCFNVSTIENNIKKAYLYVYSNEANISIDRSFSDNILKYGEKSDLNIILTNNGGRNSEYVYYEENIPEAFEIDDVKGATQQGNVISWKGSLESNNQHTIEISFTAIGGSDTTSKGSVVFYNGIKNISLDSKGVRLYADEAIPIELLSQKEEYVLGESASFYLIIENDGEQNGKIREISIDIPQGFTIDEVDNAFDVNDDRISYQGTLEPGEELNLSFALVSQKTGLYSLPWTAEFLYGPTKRENKGSVGFLIGSGTVEITPSITENQIYTSGQEMHIFAKIHNLNAFSNLRNVSMQLYLDDALVTEKTLGSVNKNTEIIALDHTMYAPIVTEKKTITMQIITNFTIQDKSDGQIITRRITLLPKTDITLNITGPNTAIELSKVNLVMRIDGMEKIESPKVHIEPNIWYKISQMPYFKDGHYVAQIEPALVSHNLSIEVPFVVNYVRDNKDHQVRGLHVLEIVPDKPDILLIKSIPLTINRAQFYQVNYIIKNNDEHAISNIRIIPKYDQRYDIYGEENIVATQVGSKDEITIKGELLRIKEPGVTTVPPSTLYFTDQHDRELSITPLIQKITVEDAAMQTGAAKVVQYTKYDAYRPGERFVVTTNFTNIGLQNINGTALNISFNVPFTKPYQLNRSFRYENIGEFTIDPILFTYSYDDKLITTMSNPLVVSIQYNVTRTDQLVHEKLSLWERLSNFVKNLFFKTTYE